MIRKSNGITAKLTDSELATSILESANQIWLAGLGAFAMARDEGNKTFDTFVKEGRQVQARAKKVAGTRLEEVREKAAGTWDKLEDVFETRVAKALRGLSVPHKRDIDALAKRVTALTAAVEELSAKTARPAKTVRSARPAQRSTARPAAKRAQAARPHA